MIAVKEEEKPYLDDFSRVEKELARFGPPSLQRARRAAAARFGEVGFPTLDDEEWRFTSVASLARLAFKLPDFEAAPPIPEALAGAIPADALVFVNGVSARPVKPRPGGVMVSRLSEALKQCPELVEPYLTRLASSEGSPFTALNTSFLREGAFVYVPRGVAVTVPIHLVFLATTDEPVVAHPRNLVVVEEGGQVTLVESYLGIDGEQYFTNAVTEVAAAERAVIDHYKVQQESKNAFHVATMQVQQARASTFSTHAITLGGGLVRNDVNVVLDGEGCEATVNGLYVASGRQFVDNHTRIDHARPHCASHELYKGILDGQAKGVFNGKIYVHADAQKTDAKQTNKTLLLSDDAVINTKPQLEIFADDVKCTHGATIGQLDAESIFYLRARGIGLAEARSLLTYAFANDVVNRIKVEAVRRQLEQVLLARQNLPPMREIS